jgi:hypothetical protein
MIPETTFQQFDGFACLWVYKNNWLQGLALISRKNTGDATALTDVAALCGLSSLSDGQSMHFPQDSGMWPPHVNVRPYKYWPKYEFRSEFWPAVGCSLAVCIHKMQLDWILMDSEHCAGCQALILIFMILFLIVIHKHGPLGERVGYICHFAIN